MKKLLPILMLPALILFCNFSKQAEEKFTVDIHRSSVGWKASKVGGSHEGSVKLASGSLIFAGNSLKSGTFTIDMRSISVSGMKGNSKENLLNHLRSNDFFAVADYPASVFQVNKVTATGASQVMISGNLTIKGITHPLSFPANIKMENKVVIAEASAIRVDRTKYDIKYRSLRFFSDIADKAIDDEFEISVKLIAKK